MSISHPINWPRPLQNTYQATTNNLKIADIIHFICLTNILVTTVVKLFLDNLICLSIVLCCYPEANSSLLMILHFTPLIFFLVFHYSVFLSRFPQWYFGFLPCFSCSCLTFPSASQLMVLNTIPMCSSQYERMFNTSRVPGVEAGRASLVCLHFAILTRFLDASECLRWAQNAVWFTTL